MRGGPAYRPFKEWAHPDEDVYEQQLEYAARLSRRLRQLNRMLSRYPPRKKGGYCEICGLHWRRWPRKLRRDYPFAHLNRGQRDLIEQLRKWNALAPYLNWGKGEIASYVDVCSEQCFKTRTKKNYLEWRRYETEESLSKAISSVDYWKGEADKWRQARRIEKAAHTLKRVRRWIRMTEEERARTLSESGGSLQTATLPLPCRR